MATITISLPDTLKDFVELQMATKGYGNISEYFRTLLRDAQQKENDERLRALLLEGLSSGEGHIATPEFWSDLKAEAALLLDKKAKKSSS
ncbi:type II toxin-antitoxin system ParD family antitoxin [Neorhizobium galegae]|uniref:ribbon-helix-helix domain-containing protein n=1 Tax=Neorhizobium galegae TaxID=399 RepID=UPI0006210500|nr:transcriptional regulator [Neorhizobium galegae]MCQ1575052.1 type II toxin-antitoxin system ParD family antitoxin [Neorhizobium galegae]CDZ61185.1 Hypothetical protein NGAL_HAMBI2605_13700 [Neorhizobium galegae bv. orientalis]